MSPLHFSPHTSDEQAIKQVREGAMTYICVVKASERRGRDLYLCLEQMLQIILHCSYEF